MAEEENHGWTFGFLFGGLIAGLLLTWPANCVGQGLFGRSQSVPYDQVKESLGQIHCTSVVGLPRLLELDNPQTFLASVVFGGLLAALYEIHLWWRRPRAASIDRAT
jgi:hypothetical protein